MVRKNNETLSFENSILTENKFCIWRTKIINSSEFNFIVDRKTQFQVRCNLKVYGIRFYGRLFH